MRFTIWRGAFVSVALAYGRWCRRISDRTGHPAGATIAKDERHQTFSELVLGDVLPFVEAPPELQGGPAAAHQLGRR
ncbi:MAG TPA: hypothetical protein VER33_00295 [Polyangiaceae bacterium]|nr:hypothetical protein [Polyangiaceae bacterium]